MARGSTGNGKMLFFCHYGSPFPSVPPAPATRYATNVCVTDCPGHTLFLPVSRSLPVHVRLSPPLHLSLGLSTHGRSEVDVTHPTSSSDACGVTFSGPLFGGQMRQPDEGTEAARQEEEILHTSGLTLDTFEKVQLWGDRRPGRLRLHPTSTNLRMEVVAADGSHGGVGDGGGDAMTVDVSQDSQEEGGALRFQFFLPSGCYATCLLREFMKVGEEDGKSLGDDMVGRGTAAGDRLASEGNGDDGGSRGGCGGRGGDGEGSKG